MNKKILTSLVVIGFAVAMASSGIAQSEDDESSDIDVSVEEDLKLNVAPVSLSYSDIDPGNFEEVSDDGFTGVEIENTGSENITRVYARSSMPDDNPLGTGTAAAYDAGNFVQLDPVSELSQVATTGDYRYVSRKDFNVTNPLAYFTEPDGASDVRYGRYRTGNESFFWAIEPQDSGDNLCSGDSTSPLYVGDVSQTQDRTGTVDFSDGGADEDITEYTIETDGNSPYGIAPEVEFQTFDGNKNYTVQTWCGDGNAESADNSSHIVTQKWATEDPDGDSELNDLNQYEAEAILSASEASDHMTPGDNFEVDLRVSVPNAVAQGQVSQGQLTVVVEGTTE